MTRRRPSPLTRQLHQVRTWAQQGRTDVWIAHKLETTPEVVADFRAEHGLARGGGGGPEPVTPERIAEVVELEGPRERPAPRPAEPTETPDGEPPGRRRTRRRRGAESGTEAQPEAAPAPEPVPDEAAVRRRRRSPSAPAREEPATAAASAPRAEPAPPATRRRRGAAGGGSAEAPARAPIGAALSRAVSLGLDASVLDDPVFREHWLQAGALEAEITPDAIVVRRRDR